jgi:hypothetical protein
MPIKVMTMPHVTMIDEIQIEGRNFFIARFDGTSDRM